MIWGRFSLPFLLFISAQTLIHALASSSQNLFVDTVHMGILANSIAYQWAYLKQVAKYTHKNNMEFKGVDVDEHGHIIPAPKSLSDMIAIFDENEEVIMNHPAFGDQLGGGPGSLENILDNMREYKKQYTDEADALILQRYDEKYQEEELVYGIATDDINKRIIVFFRGTENDLAFRSNWRTNTKIIRAGNVTPPMLQERLENPDSIAIHRGFHGFLFDVSENNGNRAYDEIIGQVRELLADEERKDYQVYVTGHSLGAALSTVFSFYLSTESDIPKPVKCINFASPRVGNRGFLAGVKSLEENGYLQMVRIINNADVVPTIPSAGYAHVGFQVKFFDEDRRGTRREAELFYPSVNLGFGSWFSHSLGNRVSLFNAVQVGQEHAGSEYNYRIIVYKDFLSKYTLDGLYSDSSLTGFKSEL